MKCEDYQRLISQYLDKELTPQDKLSVEAHLKACPTCLQKLETWQKNDQFLAAGFKSFGPLIERAEAKVSITFKESSDTSTLSPKEIASSIPSRRNIGTAEDGSLPLAMTNKGKFQQSRPLPLQTRLLRYAAVAAVIIVIGFLGTWGYINTLEPDPQDTSILVPSNLIPNTFASIRVFIKDHFSFMPIAEADVVVDLESKTSGKITNLGRFKTDKYGTLQTSFKVPDLPDGDYQLMVKTSSSAGHDLIKRSITLKRSFKLLLSTDKPIYQPLQMIHIRAISLNNFDLKPVHNQAITFEVEDPKANKVFKRVIPSSEYGIAAVDFQLADEIILGEYRVRVSAGDTTSEKTVQVKRYVLPKFKIELETDKDFYLPNEILKGTLSANYFFGKPVQQAQVRIELASFIEVFHAFKTISGQTNKDGKFSFTAELPAQFFGTPLEKGNALLKLEAVVTDTAEHQEKTVQAIVIARESIKVAIIPESHNIVPGIENIFYIATSYPDGRVAPRTTVRVTGPSFTKEIITDSLGIGKVELAPPTSLSSFKLDLIAHDKQGNHGTATFPPRLPTDADEMNEQLMMKAERRLEWWVRSGQPEDDTIRKLRQEVEAWRREKDGVLQIGNFLIRTDQAIYQAGQTMQVLILSPHLSGNFFVDLIKGKQTLLTKIVEVRGGQGVLLFDLPAELFGPLILHAYKIQPDGNIARDTHIIMVEQGLKIEAQLDRQTYQPGQTAQVLFSITDQQGNSIPGALSISVVDESVFALAEAEPGLERVYYEIEKDVMQPRYQIKGLLAPILPTAPTIPPEQQEEQRQNATTIALAAIVPAVDASIENNYPAKERSLKQLKRGFNTIASNILLILIGGVIALALLFVFIIRPIYYLITLCIKGQWRVFLIVSIWFALLIFAGYIVSTSRDYTRRGDWIDLITLTGIVSWVIFVIVANSALAKPKQATRTKKQIIMSAVFNTCVIIGIIGILSALFMPTLCSVRKCSLAGSIRSIAHQMETLNQLRETSQLAPPRVTGSQQPRIRQFFPETLLWEPQIITDQDGKATLTIPLADSITTWRMAIQGISKKGHLGSVQKGIVVFQDFFIDLDLPVSLTQGDEIAIPVAVYNYLAAEQEVNLKLEKSDWFELMDDHEKRLSLSPCEVTVRYFRIRVKEFGQKDLTVFAYGSKGLSDAIRRSIEILPNGKEGYLTINDRLSGSISNKIAIPPNAIDNASNIIIKVYPSTFSQVVDGLERLVQLPYG